MVSLARVSRSWSSIRRRSASWARASSCRAAATGAGRAMERQQGRGRPGRGDPLGDAAGDELAQRGVQPAGGLGAQPGQLAVPVGPHPQHHGMVIGADGLADRASGARRSPPTGRRSGRSCSSCPSRQQPDPGAELGLDVDDLLPGGHELLSQQVPEAARALDRPGPLRPVRRPFHQPGCLGAEARTRTVPSGRSAASIATAVCDPLCGSTPIITAANSRPLLRSSSPGMD